MNLHQQVILLQTLRDMPEEVEWVEFKHNAAYSEEIGEYISSLSNSAALLGKEAAYLVWGVEDETHDIIGTSFRPHKEKIGNQELESWLSVHLTPRIDFRFYELQVEGKSVVLLEIQPCLHTPVRWKDVAYIRIGSYKKKLKDRPEKERILWLQLSKMSFEKGIALRDVSDDEVLDVLNYSSYFDLTAQKLPSTKLGILERLTSERMISPKDGNRYDVTNLGAILFAKKLSAFEALGRKAVRVIEYKGNNRIYGGREYISDEGYVSGFERLITYINSRLPGNEEIGQAFRVDVRMYPEIAIRELVPNALLHQDFGMTGDSPLIEIFTDRVEIINAGQPLINTLRFIDEPPQSRNEILASFMRRVKICEERGSGIDKTIAAVELFQLPAPDFDRKEKHTRVALYAHRDFKEMSSKDRIRACYQHACLMYVSNQQMTNATLRKRFAIEDEKYPIVSKVIADTIKAELLKPYDPDNKSPKHARYVPYWA